MKCGKEMWIVTNNGLW